MVDYSTTIYRYIDNIVLINKQINFDRLGLSLVEILIVVAIIGILATLILPFAGRWQSTALTAKGTHHARQLMVGVQGYTAEHRGIPPKTDFSSWPDPSGYTRWVDELAPYVYGSATTNPAGHTMVDGVFRCPGLGGYKKCKNQWVPWDWDNIDWMPVAFHRPDNGNYAPLNTLTAANSKTPFLVSTDKNDGSSGLSEGDQASFDRYVPPSVWKYQGGVIVGFLDGHVEVVPEPNSTNIFKK